MLAHHNSVVRAIDIAISFVDREEQRLRAIIESKKSSDDEKFQALQDLAYLTGVVVRELADMAEPIAESKKKPELNVIQPAPAKRPARHGRTEAGTDAQSAQFHQDVCDNLSEGVYFVDKERKITYWNRGAQNMTGYQREDAVGRHCYDNMLRHVDANGKQLCFNGCPLSATLKDGQAREAEVFLHDKGGRKVPVAVRVSPVVNSAGKLIGAVEVFSNITGQKELERRAKELEEMAYSDELTGLSNRRHIELKLKQAQEEVEQFERKAGVLLLDVDGFKQVNDVHGHAAGDTVLKTVSDRLAGTLRTHDAAGRWGGDEFLLVAMDVSLGELEAIAERCREAIGGSWMAVEDKTVNVTVSVGAALLKKGVPVDAALKRADELLYVAKCLGGNKTRARVEV